MHTPQEYKKLQDQIDSEQKKIDNLQKERKNIKEVIKDLKSKQDEIIRNSRKQELEKRNIQINKDYWKMIAKWKEKFKYNEIARLDQLSEHYRVMIKRLSDNRKSILYILVKAGIPLSAKEISEDRIFKSMRNKNITSKYISATLNGDGMYSIPKDKMYKFEIFEKNEEGKYFISSKDPDFLKWLKMRFKK